jgi:hypothetical protein
MNIWDPFKTTGGVYLIFLECLRFTWTDGYIEAALGLPHMTAWVVGRGGKIKCLHFVSIRPRNRRKQRKRRLYNCQIFCLLLSSDIPCSGVQSNSHGGSHWFKSSTAYHEKSRS